MNRMISAAGAASLSLLFTLQSAAANAGPFDNFQWADNPFSSMLDDKGNLSMGLEGPPKGRTGITFEDPRSERPRCPRIVERLSNGFSRSIAGGRGEFSIDIEGLEKLKIKEIELEWTFMLDNDLTIVDRPPSGGVQRPDGPCR